MKKAVILVPIILALLVILFSFWNSQLSNELEEKQQELKELMEHNEALKEEKQNLKEERKMIDKLNQILNRLDWVEKLEVRNMNITKYAPLDPNAEEGMCYSGDRNITASGSRVEVGITAAAGSDLPFGSLIIVPDKGVYKVQDRGGAIGNNDLDLTTHSLDNAQSWGVQEKEVLIIRR